MTHQWATKRILLLSIPIFVHEIITIAVLIWLPLDRMSKTSNDTYLLYILQISPILGALWFFYLCFLRMGIPWQGLDIMRFITILVCTCFNFLFNLFYVSIIMHNLLNETLTFILLCVECTILPCYILILLGIVLSFHYHLLSTTIETTTMLRSLMIT